MSFYLSLGSGELLKLKLLAIPRTRTANLYVILRLLSFDTNGRPKFYGDGQEVTNTNGSEPGPFEVL
jgi:hypothetical protein